MILLKVYNFICSIFRRFKMYIVIKDSLRMSLWIRFHENIVNDIDL